MANHDRKAARSGEWKMRHYVGYAVTVAAVALSAYLIYRTLSQYGWNELVDAVTSISLERLLGALGFTAASYLCLTGIDWLALRYAGHPLPYRQAALASFTSLSLGHNIGLAALSSGAIRYRYYSRWGLGAEDVAKVVLFCGLTVVLGLSVLGGIGLFGHPEFAEKFIRAPLTTIYAIACLCLVLPAAYAILAFALAGRALAFRGRRLELPAGMLAVGQIALGTLNFAFVAAALHQAILSVAEVPYLEAAAVYVSANVAAVITHAPGGLGVIESVVLFLLPGAQLIGAVLVFRFAYFLVPLALGSVLLAGSELLLSGSKAAPEPR